MHALNTDVRAPQLMKTCTLAIPRSRSTRDKIVGTAHLIHGMIKMVKGESTSSVIAMPYITRSHTARLT